MYRGFAPVSTIVRYNRGKGFAKRGQVLCRACKVCKVWGKGEGGGGVRSGLGGKGVTGQRRKAAEGSRPLPTMQKIKGRHSKAAGRACPAPTDCCFRHRGFGGAWRRTTSAASLLRKHARAVVCPAGANIARSPVSLRSTVAPGSQPRNPRLKGGGRGGGVKNEK